MVNVRVGDEANSSGISVDAIDAVITWVDGEDPHHKAKLDAYLQSIGISKPRAASPSRFYDANEIEYCVVSLLRFAPWIRHIYIVTDNQQPKFIETLAGTEYATRVHMIDHQTIFEGNEDCLPTFNIRSIMALLWKIPGISEKFIFLNDDFVLLRPLAPDAFFKGNKLVLRGIWTTFSDRLLSKRLVAAWRKLWGANVPQEQRRVKHLVAQEYSAGLAGMTRQYYQLPHNPHPFRCSLMAKFQAQNTLLFRKNIEYRFRSPDQFISECLVAHLAISAGDAELDNRLKTVQLKPAEQSFTRTRKKIQQADSSTQFVFGCIQNLTESPEEIKQEIFQWLDRRVGSLEAFLKSAAVNAVLDPTQE